MKLLGPARSLVPLALFACTQDNPDYRPASVAVDAGATRPADLARGFDLAPHADLAVLPDLLHNIGPGADVAEDVLAGWGAGEATSDTLEACNPTDRGHVHLAAEPVFVKIGSEAVRVGYGPDQSYYFEAFYPAGKNGGWDLSSRNGLDFFESAVLPQSYTGWDPPGPTVVLCGPNGHRQLSPSANQLPRVNDSWIELKVPLAGGPGWTRTDSGQFSLGRVDWVEFHVDPLRGGGTGTVYFYLDGVRFF